MQPCALITGATGGIGHSIARALAPTHRLYLLGRDADALRRLAADFPSATGLQADLSDPGALAGIAADLPELQVLVHSAGVLRMGSVEQGSDADWAESLQVNVLAPVALTRALLPQLRRSTGHVFLINSGLGHRTLAGSGPYSASKFALKAFADALRLEEAPHGVRVTSIHPGRVATGMQRQLHDWEQRNYDPQQWVHPDQVADVLLSALALGGHANVDTLSINPTPVARP